MWTRRWGSGRRGLTPASPTCHQIHQRAGEQGHEARLGSALASANANNPGRQKLTSGTAPPPHCETVVQDDRCVPDTQGAGLTPRHRLPRTRPAPFMNPRSTSTVEDGSPLLRAGKPRRSRSRTATLPDSKAALVAEWTLTVTFGVFIHNLTTAATIRSVQRHHPHAEHCAPRSRPRARV